MEGMGPMPALVSTVIAPRRRDYEEAVRARGDLERVGRMVQENWRGSGIGEGQEDEEIQQNGQ